ncbi:uncharacterized protein, partial [Temnothorax nylanderi]|uniref:uncharacterized protein n=1 Tax=Temnothorax nylanderi TaxID=102681 RepID=UPI003A86AF60
MHEEIQVQTTENNSIPDLQLGFLTKRGIDRGRYNVQKVNEVAAVFSTTADGEIPETYVTIYNKCNKTLQQVSTMDPNVEPWIYPLYYPYGNQGWHGSPRNMLQHYQDAMAIVRKYGKPDIFITMTCNPNWREIRENLLPGQQPADRPDICARVFNIKKDYLIDVIVRQKFFGEVLAYVYVIEFQKRGLPHIHLLITLKQNCKILNPETVDRFISAEIPDPNENESLHNVVMKHMIHGPCGDWCLINDKCSKHFPKPFQPETTMDEDGYPQYHRRNNGLLYERPGRGATSFQKLRTVNNEVHETFTAACLALGLIEDDEEWYRAMNEAKVWMMPRRLRNLFVRILIHCQPVYPKKLWDEFKKDMSEDYIRRFGPIIGIKKAYNYIINFLQIEGSNISNFPEMEQETEEQETNNVEQIEEDTLIGGTGKTFIYTTLYYLLKNKGKVVSTMAFTGIAATLLPNGRTIHKVFGLPVPLFADSTSNIKVQSKEAENLKLVDVFVIDEAPMAPRYVLEIMDRTLRDIMQNDLYFG